MNEPMESKVHDFLEELTALSKKHGLYVIGGNIETFQDEIIAENLDHIGEYVADMDHLK